MSESKSKITSFRLSSELEALASAAAAAAGDKNASAWCQRLAVEALSKISEPCQNESVEQIPEPDSFNDLLKAVGNVRQLNLDCFKMALKDEEHYKEFLKVVIASEEDWETINRSIGKPEPEFLPITNKPTAAAAAAKSPAESAISAEENKSPEVQIAAQVSSNEYLSFAEEMKNEVAELITGAPKLPGFYNDQTLEFGESAKENRVPVVLPIVSSTERTDAGEGL